METEQETLEPTLDVEVAPAMEPLGLATAQAPASATPPSRYWRAQGLAEMVQREFDAARQSERPGIMRERFYLLANYYTRTLAILHYAVNQRREPLVQATLHNVIALHKALHHMHQTAPSAVPSTLSLSREVRPKLQEALIVRVLQEAPEPLDLATVTRRVNDLDVLADARESVIRGHLSTLVSTGHVETRDGLYARTARGYTAVNLDQAGLRTLLGAPLSQEVGARGFRGLSEVATRKAEFRALLGTLTTFGEGTAALVAAAAELLGGTRSEAPALSPWRHADLIGSPHVRPYQYQAYAIFRGYGYQGQVIEAPTGSGKTLIGMMCIQDWLRTLSEGQSVLVLVPTVNYQQQWVGELCYKPTGLRLSPHLVFTGTPGSLETTRQRTGLAPAVMVMTYAALAQTGSGIGKGGFDQDSIEIFLQANNIKYIVLDEVHKVVEDMRSVSADVTRTLTEWVRDGSLKGMIGFSGTAAAFRPRFAQLGLQLVYILPAAELIAYGFVAPFAELGVPFAYSDREQRVRDVLDTYKARLREYVTLLGSPALRGEFAAIPLAERVAIGSQLLRMYAGHKEQETAVARRLQSWEQGGELGLAELPVITIIQLARGWSDVALMRAMTQDAADPESATRQARFEEVLAAFNALREELRPLIYLTDTLRRLNAEGFGTACDADGMRRLVTEVTSSAARAERVKDGLATTVVGLYTSLSDWYLRVGEGRVATIKAIIEAERASRPIHGVIVFDAATRIRWQAGLAVPGYGGVAGVFSQMLGDSRFTPMAVLSNELYLAYDEADPLSARIAEFIKREIMLGDLADALFGLATQGLDLSEERLEHLRHALEGLLAQYVSALFEVGAVRPREFYRKVLAPFRRVVRRSGLGAAQDQLLARLSLRHYHVRDWVSTFFDYALIVGAFLKARVAELEQVSGARQRFLVVRMAQGDRKQLMYDLTARIVDAEDLPINMIIVSPWARTGWNVIKPNVLIDATATRDVTAWQQLRGRAMRAMRTWTNECYRLVLLLLSARSEGLADAAGLPEDVVTAYEEMRDQSSAAEVLDDAAKTMLHTAHRKARQRGPGGQIHATEDTLAASIDRGVIAEFTPAMRAQLVTELMLHRNKVTHIYELVKAYGGASQVHYNRGAHVWERTESIAAKHGHEFAVSPLDGRFGAGPEHAPLIYAGDPRKDVPSELEAHLTAAIKDCDPLIVSGWLSVIAAGAGDEVALE